ncbi:UDP-N-acetylglucosamine 2-epimerase (non-hydrolyzing) [Flavobacteriaceae bacterium]|nr:UDP-N-acetylglucosamine 2-epimerase (non-hydrolyzing) [Flavobacteriaceae bacterium]
MKKLLFIIGTRPEAIKMAPLILESMNNPKVQTFICSSSQHESMLTVILDFFEISLDYDLKIMTKNQTLSNITEKILSGLNKIFQNFHPDYVFVHGDTNTAFASSLAAFYNQIPVVHVEAGLRTYNRYSPYPEEINRRLISEIASIHFAPTKLAFDNLKNENITQNVFEVGNTVIDTLRITKEIINKKNLKEIEILKSKIPNDKKIILVTGHRRENFGFGFENICNAILEISKNKSVFVVYPVHLNPSVQKTVYDKLGDSENILLLDPLGYPEFVWLLNKCYLVLTDSGGIQEEAPSFNKPVLVMRDNTERPEAINAGVAKLVGTNPEIIVKNILYLLNDDEYLKMINKTNPFGDGFSSERIINKILNFEN